MSSPLECGRCVCGVARVVVGARTVVHVQVLPASLLSAFSVEELLALVNGAGDIDAAGLMMSVQYEGDLTPHSDIVKWFWAAFADLTGKERALLIKFVTGTVRVPLDGLEPPFTIVLGTHLSPEALPVSHTCFNQLVRVCGSWPGFVVIVDVQVLPAYSSRGTLIEKLKYAISNSASFELS